MLIGNLSNDDGDGKDKRCKTIGLISKNNHSAHLFYILVYFFLPSSAKQQHEMTTFKVL